MTEFNLASLKERFQDIFNQSQSQAFFAPGRINLIGEHTDYNGGHVFPAAISHGTYGIANLNGSDQVRVISLNFEDQGVIEFDLDDGSYNKDHGWANFVKGMVHYLKEAGHTIDQGFDLLVWGNIPNASGLSSSASLELLVGVTLEELYDLTLERLDLVRLGQKVENDFIGVNSGIMDQFAVGMGKRKYALYLDTNTLEYELVPADFGKYMILIMNTNKRRELADSNYNERRSQCEEALRRIQTVKDVPSLGALSYQELKELKDVIDDEVLYRRAKHAVTENERTELSKRALELDDLQAFGVLLNQSHQSLRDDYEVTGRELDTLVECAWEQPGVLGARMTGAGMGGCAIALVDRYYLDSVQETLGQHYEETIGYPASFYVARIGDGAKALDTEE